MRRLRWRHLVAMSGILVIGLASVALFRTPMGVALMKSRTGFSPTEADPRVLAERGAEHLAAPVAAFLDEAIRIVEEAHGGPFLRPFRVYVCATQGSLNEFVGLPPAAPIRGTVRFGEVFLAPSAFDWRGQDVHKESLLHELSHLHLRQHLGFFSYRGKVPSWFHEGLANLVSGAGGEGISDEEAVSAILGGRTLRPDSTGRFWSLRRVEDSGLGGPMLHKQSRMFLAFLRGRNPETFRNFLLRLEEEKAFAAPFREYMGDGVPGLWDEFVASLGPE